MMCSFLCLHPFTSVLFNVMCFNASCQVSMPGLLPCPHRDTGFEWVKFSASLFWSRDDHVLVLWVRGCVCSVDPSLFLFSPLSSSSLSFSLLLLSPLLSSTSLSPMQGDTVMGLPLPSQKKKKKNMDNYLFSFLFFFWGDVCVKGWTINCWLWCHVSPICTLNSVQESRASLENKLPLLFPVLQWQQAAPSPPVLQSETGLSCLSQTTTNKRLALATWRLFVSCLDQICVFSTQDTPKKKKMCML